MNASLTITGLESTALSITTEARTRRDELLAMTRKGTTINNPESAKRAAALLVDVKNFTRVIEASRSDVKAPVLDLGKKIDALAKELTNDLEAEATRISRLLGTYQAEQNRIAEELQRKAYEEERRIRQEAEQAEREAQAKAADEAAALAEKERRARTVAGKERAAAEAAAAALRAEQDQMRRDDEMQQQVISTRMNAVATVAPKPAGVATRHEIRFEVIDAVALYEAAPYLVSLIPNVTAIKAALKGLAGDQALPGVRHWREAVTIVR